MTLTHPVLIFFLNYISQTLASAEIMYKHGFSTMESICKPICQQVKSLGLQVLKNTPSESFADIHPDEVL